MNGGFRGETARGQENPNKLNLMNAVKTSVIVFWRDGRPRSGPVESYASSSPGSGSALAPGMT